MVAAVNPCGILLLPSLVAYYLGGDDSPQLTAGGRAARAALLGVMATAGFVVLFAGFGLAFAATGRALGAAFPVGGLAVGIGLTALGLWLVVTGRSVGLASASRAMAGVRFQADARSMFLFGVGYGVASLACTLPVFLVVVGTTLAASGVTQAAVQFVLFALGMGTIVTAVIVGAAFVRSAVTRSLHVALPLLHRVAASLLLGAGIFLTHYWVVNYWVQ
jgi:cytochrome c biogenesis protein CcdA